MAKQTVEDILEECNATCDTDSDGFTTSRLHYVQAKRLIMKAYQLGCIESRDGYDPQGKEIGAWIDAGALRSSIASPWHLYESVWRDGMKMWEHTFVHSTELCKKTVYTHCKEDIPYIGVR